MAVRGNSEVLALVAPAPKEPLEKAFTIPGLQNRPYEKDELAAVFDILDLDGHDSVGPSDIRRVIALIGDPEPSNLEVLEMIRIMDPQGSGRIDFQNFKEHFMHPPLLFRDFDLFAVSQESDANGADDLPPSLIAAMAASKSPSKLSAGRSPSSTKSGSKEKGSKEKAGTKDLNTWITVDQRAQAVPAILGGRRGGLRPDFIKELYETVVELDVNDSGYVNYPLFCSALGLPQSDELKEAFNAFDTTGMGELDLREFVVGLSLFTEGTTEEERLRFAFMMYDEEQQGSLKKGQLDELIHALMPLMKASMREGHINRLYSTGALHQHAKCKMQQFVDYALEHSTELLPARD